MSQHEVEGSADSDSGTVSDSSSPQTSDTDSKEVVSQGGGLTDSQAPPTKQQGNVFPYPPGFKQIQERVGRFTGKCGEEDFDVWLADFREATGDCKWTDKQRAQWFSWFLGVHGREHSGKKRRNHGLTLFVFTKGTMESTWNHALPTCGAMS